MTNRTHPLSRFFAKLRRAAFCASRGGDPMMAPGGATLYFVLDGKVTAVLAGLKA